MPTTTPTSAPATTGATPTTARLLAAGALAAPVFAVAVLAQAATRDGFDLTRHPASLLATGDLGAVQVATFVACGVLMLAYGAGARRALRSGPGSVWAPRLLTVQGVGLVAAGVFRMDPVDGFPAGTPAGTPATFTWHAMVHNLAGSVTFLALIATCFVLARRVGGTWGIAGRVCGTGFAAGLAWAFGGGTAGSLTLFVGCVGAWSWTCLTATRLETSGSPR
jgi:hypothetical protein